MVEQSGVRSSGGRALGSHHCQPFFRRLGIEEGRIARKFAGWLHRRRAAQEVAVVAEDHGPGVAVVAEDRGPGIGVVTEEYALDGCRGCSGRDGFPEVQVVARFPDDLVDVQRLGKVLLRSGPQQPVLGERLWCSRRAHQKHRDLSGVVRPLQVLADRVARSAG